MFWVIISCNLALASSFGNEASSSSISISKKAPLLFNIYFALIILKDILINIRAFAFDWASIVDVTSSISLAYLIISRELGLGELSLKVENMSAFGAFIILSIQLLLECGGESELDSQIDAI